MKCAFTKMHSEVLSGEQLRSPLDFSFILTGNPLRRNIKYVININILHISGGFYG